jgi:aspartate kinase
MLIVQKYGGTSVGSLERMENVAAKVARARLDGHAVVVVVSAMSGETDRLLNLARPLTDEISAPREVDVLLATGEQVNIALMAMTLKKQGIPARSYTGFQVAVHTDSAHTKARIIKIDRERLRADIEKGIVPVIAGFQGVDEHGDITTLGRGGSDTTAVAIAAALGADECQIYTDVDGVYTTDPRIVPEARRLKQITVEEMLEMASLGSKVLQIRSVAFAGKYRVRLRVLSSFLDESEGTLITFEENKNMEEAVISGIAFQRNEAKIVVQGVPDRPGLASQILDPIAKANINIDMIVQNASIDGLTDFSFTVERQDFKEALAIVENLRESIGAKAVFSDGRIAKVSVIGVGMRTHAGIAAKMFSTFADEGINIQMISTSEIKISVVIEEKYLELAVRALHEAFQLNQDSI